MLPVSPRYPVITPRGDPAPMGRDAGARANASLARHVAVHARLVDVTYQEKGLLEAWRRDA